MCSVELIQNNTNWKPDFPPELLSHSLDFYAPLAEKSKFLKFICHCVENVNCDLVELDKFVTTNRNMLQILNPNSLQELEKILFKYGMRTTPPAIPRVIIPPTVPRLQKPTDPRTSYLHKRKRPHPSSRSPPPKRQRTVANNTQNRSNLSQSAPSSLPNPGINNLNTPNRHFQTNPIREQNERRGTTFLPMDQQPKERSKNNQYPRPYYNSNKK